MILPFLRLNRHKKGETKPSNEGCTIWTESKLSKSILTDRKGNMMPNFAYEKVKRRNSS